MKVLQIMLIAIISTSIYAKIYKGVLITKTSNEENLKYIKHDLDRLNVKMFIKKRGHEYFVYSKKFSDIDEFNKIYKKIKTKFKYAVVIGSKVNKEKETITKELKNRHFINVASGFSHINLPKTSSKDINEIGRYGLNFLLEGGYIFNDIFVPITYTYTKTKDISIMSFFTSINYKIDISPKTYIYSGLIGGYGKLRLLQFRNSEASSSMITGLNLGLDYKLYKSIVFSTSYRLLISNYIVNIHNPSAKAKFKYNNNLFFGIKFYFDN